MQAATNSIPACGLPERRMIAPQTGPETAPAAMAMIISPATSLAFPGTALVATA